MTTILQRTITLAALGGLAAGLSLAASLTLGEQDHTDGQLIGLPSFNAAASGEPVPFDTFYGSDPGGTFFSQSWTFSFAAAPVADASITIGIFDHDSGLTGSQIASFTLDGLDLTAGLNALFEGSGGAQTEYNVYALVLGGASLAALADGSATFSLTLSNGPGQSGNGAGLDFSTLTYNNGEVSGVPEPATVSLFGLGGFFFVVARRRFRR